MSQQDLFVDAPSTREKVAPEPEIYRRAEDAERDLDKVASDLSFAEGDLGKAAKKRDDLQIQIVDQEQRTGLIRDEVAADALHDPDKKKDLGNKEKRDAEVAKCLRQSDQFCREDRKLQQLKTEHRNVVTDYELAVSRVKSLHRRVDAMTSKARLISSQLSSLGHLLAYDTAKIQIGAQRK